MNKIIASGLACGLSMVGAAAKVEFEKPVRLVGGDELIKVEKPGYAAPSLADLDGDGKKDLLVGQFNKGKIKIYPGVGGGKFGKGDWLRIGDEIAEVPGVW